MFSVRLAWLLPGVPVTSADVPLTQMLHMAKLSFKRVRSRLHLAGQEGTANSQPKGVWVQGLRLWGESPPHPKSKDEDAGPIFTGLGVWVGGRQGDIQFPRPSVRMEQTQQWPTVGSMRWVEAPAGRKETLQGGANDRREGLGLQPRPLHSEVSGMGGRLQGILVGSKEERWKMRPPATAN